ncbi:MAG TPA: FtsW/RodA/SpoVE family cell cycle protein [Anaerolineales bacterium]|nr:FtsW/RodA/SpoVE family cell cycle protein [Anaerolineales bacterium]
MSFKWEHWSGFFVWLLVVFLAHRQTNQRLPYRDPYLLPIAALLSGLGLLTIWRLYPDLGLRQTFWLGIVGALFYAGLRLPNDLSFLRRYKYLWLSAGLLLTALTLVFGTNPLGYGPRMWLGCCGIYFQPSEPLKLLLIVYLSAYLADRLFSPSTSSTPLLPLLAPTLFMTGLVMSLLLVQRDLGTASLFLCLYTSIVYVTTNQKRILLFGSLALLIAGIAGYALFDVVQIRVNAWLNPWLDPSGDSYQIVQSLLAVANGGYLGRGPGMGNPSLVPIAHSDFIFSAIAEELGLVGTLALGVLLAIFLNRGLRVALKAHDAYRRFLSAGLITHIVAQSVLISGGNLRLLPLTGVTYPFVSYGGSSLLTSFLSLLILLHISNRSENFYERNYTESKSYLQLGGFLFTGICMVALASGWWAVIRGPDLLARTDNPRRTVADIYVTRGSILDRRNEPIAATTGTPGSYSRQILYESLSPVIGYTNRIYGQSGLEASLDEYLRGLRGNSNTTIWWNQILYGQPPPGLDIRLSLDIHLQQIADQALSSHSGAVVLLNAKSGEILAMATSPSFNANLLETNWDELVADAKAPLLNRATQGRYPADNILKTLFPESSTPLMELMNPPKIRLPVGEPTDPGDPIFSPLQIALGAAAITEQGVRPAPLVVLAVNTPQAGWVLLPSLEKPSQLVTAEAAYEVATQLSHPELAIWYSVAVEQNQQDIGISWFSGGTLPGWEGLPLALVVIVEDNNPAVVENIGKTILQEALLP